MISEISASNIPRMMKEGGMEFIIIDVEHGPFDLEKLSGMIAVSNGIHLPVFVRIPGIDRGFITKILDLGADGLVAPMVNTKEEARKLVEFTKYMPLGKRGLSTNRAHTDYHPTQLEDYMKAANNRIVLLLQIETEQAVNRVEEIASVQGIDGLLAGPSDLSSDYGKPGNLLTDEMMNSIHKIVMAARKNGICSGTISSNREYLKNCKKQGMTFFSMSSELGMLIQGAKDIARSFYEEVL